VRRTSPRRPSWPTRRGARLLPEITSRRDVWAVLGDGFRVEGEFEHWRSDDALQVASSALFRQAGGSPVFRVESGRARCTPVVRGHRGGQYREVRERLAPGQWVVAYPDDRIDVGVRVVDPNQR